MSVPPVSLAPQTYGWRPSDFQAGPTSADDATAAAPAAAPRAAGGGTPLMRAMLATVTVTAADSRAGARTVDDGDDAAADLPQAVQRFTQNLVQTLRDADTAPGSNGEGYGRMGGLASRIEALAQRVAGSTAEDTAAATAPLPEPATSRLIEAFTELKAAMNEPPPNGDAARRQALGEFLNRLAQSFGGSDAPLIPTGALVSVRA